MANKKGKSKAHKGGGKPTGNPPKQKQPQAQDLMKDHQIPPQERVEAVRPFWESQAQEQRVKLLTVELGTLKERSRAITEAARQQAVAEVDSEHVDMLAMGLEPTLEEVLDEGVSRLNERSTWKLWNWPVDQKEFTDAESFRQHIAEKHIREELRKYLPRDDPKSPERPAEEAFRKRMGDLLTRIQQLNQRHYDEIAARSAAGVSGREGRGKERPGQKDKQDKDRQEREKDKDKIEKETEREKDKQKEVDKDGDKDKWDTAPVSIFKRRRHHAADNAMLAHDTNVELINIMLEALEQEHEVLYQSLVMPIIAYIMEAVSEDRRETHKMELVYEDLDKLMPDDLIHIMEWLTEKVDALSTRLKSELKEEEEMDEEENMGDVDLWSLTDDGKSLTVNGKWLQHLQERLLGEDGHPRKVKAGEDPHSNGLVLEWVYGTIVSTAEKARDGAKRPLGSYLPLPTEAHHALLRALEEQYVWDTRLQQARSLLADMLKSRLEAAELAKQYDIKPVPKNAKPEELPADDALPDHVIVAMLKREVLLTRAKLHYLLWEHLVQERQLRTWKSQLKQGEPEFERLKKELDDVKHSHRGLESTYRSQAEMERHRAQLADAAIEEQLEVQTAFREQGALLQSIYDKKQRAEYDITRKETEIKQLQGWKGTVENIIERFQDLMAAQVDKVEATPVDEEAGLAGLTDRIDPSGEGTWEQGGSAGNLSPDKYMQLVKLRNHVHKDIRKQLYSDVDDKQFFDNLKNEVKAIERKMEEARVVIQHLEMQLVNVTCDDPGIAVGAQLVLPMLQEQLDSKGKEFAAERAKMAESEVIRMEMEQAEREAAERERKRAAKAAKTARLRSEKEKERADREAREAAEQARRQQEEEARRVKEEEDRRKRLEAVEAMRKAEEECMEARRRELMSDENGYWRQRMRYEEQQAAALTALHCAQDDTVQQKAGNQRVDTSDTTRAKAAQGQQVQKQPQGVQKVQREASREQLAGSGGGGDVVDGKRAPVQSGAERDSKSSDQTKPKAPAAPTPTATPADAPAGVTTPAQPAGPANPAGASPAKGLPAGGSTPLSANAPVFASQVKTPEQHPPAPTPPAAPTTTALPVAIPATTPTPSPAASLKPVTAVPAAVDGLKPVAEPLQTHPPPGQAIYFGAVPVPVSAPPPPAPINTPAQPTREPMVMTKPAAPQPANPPAPPPAPPIIPQATPHPVAAPQPPPMPIVSPQATPHVVGYVPGVTYPAPPPPPPTSRPPGAAHPPQPGQPAAPPTPGPLPVTHNMRHVMHPPAGQPLPNGPAPAAPINPHAHIPMGMPAPAPVPHQVAQPPSRMPNAQVPAMPMQHPQFQPMMGPPGGMLVPGPAGPFYVYPNANPGGPGGMMGNPVMHSMVGQQHPAMNGIHPGGPMPNMQQPAGPGHVNMVGQQQPQQGQQPPMQHMQPQHLKVAPAVPGVRRDVSSSGGGGAEMGDLSSPGSGQDGSTPGPGLPATTPATNTSDRSLNAAAKPFVPSMSKPPVTVQVVHAVPAPVPAAPPAAVPHPQNPVAAPMTNGPTMSYVMHMNPQQGVVQQQPHAGFPGPGFPQQQQVRPQVMPMAGNAAIPGPRNDRRITATRQQPAGMMHMHPSQPHVLPQQHQQFMMMPNMPVVPVMQHPMQHQGPHMQPVMQHQQHQHAVPMHAGMVHPVPPGGMVPNMVPPPVQQQQQQQQQGPAMMGVQQQQQQQPHAVPPMQPVAPAALPAAKQQQQPVQSQQPEHEAPLQAPVSPDGPLDRSQASSASDDSASGQQQVSSADQAVKQPLPAQQQQENLPPEQQKPQGEQQGVSSEGPKQADASEAASASTSSSTPPPSSTAGQPSQQQPRSWSAIAAKDRVSAVPAPAAQQSQSGNSSSSGTPQQAQSGSQPGNAGTPPQGANNGSWKVKLQHSLIPPPAPVQHIVRWQGTPPVGNFLAIPSAHQSGARLRVTDAGLTMYEAPGAKPRSLQLIRGLRNGEGEYNCFLNVIIQSLWHLKPFREALLALPPLPTPPPVHQPTCRS